MRAVRQHSDWANIQISSADDEMSTNFSQKWKYSSNVKQNFKKRIDLKAFLESIAQWKDAFDYIGRTD